MSREDDRYQRPLTVTESGYKKQKKSLRKDQNRSRKHSHHTSQNTARKYHKCYVKVAPSGDRVFLPGADSVRQCLLVRAFPTEFERSTNSASCPTLPGQ